MGYPDPLAVSPPRDYFEPQDVSSKLTAPSSRDISRDMGHLLTWSLGIVENLGGESNPTIARLDRSPLGRSLSGRSRSRCQARLPWRRKRRKIGTIRSTDHVGSGSDYSR